MSKNEESYYTRMSSTMNDKCKTLLPYLFDGVKVIDFGAGKDLSIASLVNSFNGEYIAVDNSEQSQKYFEENGILCYGSVADIHEEVDVIFMSSVYHELISYLNPLEVAVLTKKFSTLIGNTGKIVIRDWNTLTAQEWHIEDEIEFNIDKISEIRKWISVLQDKGILEHNDTLRLTTNSVIGSRNDLYNIIYHTTWGLASIPRESQENYAIGYESILRYFYNNDLEVTKKTTNWDDSYIPFMEKYFTSYKDRVQRRDEWLSPKNELVIQKKAK